ncbi:MAG TPA: hypothetical protein VFS76_18360 [Pyrinomonadaceae bacterium]|nr:hypothetical protein [Pyrinomonadaceae bacterium]
MVTKKKGRTGTTARRAATADENGWNGATRFQAISGVFGRMLQLQEAVAMEYAPAGTEIFELSATANREMQELVASASKSSGASEEQILSWVEAFNSMGKPGLMTSIPLTAEECCANLNGTFEQISRFSGGVETATRGRIYGDMNPDKLTGHQMITMWTEENMFKATGRGTIFFIMLAELKFRQNGPYEVIVNSEATTYGNAPGYEKGLKTRDEFLLVRKGHNETMAGVPRRSESNGSDTAARFLVEVGGDPGIIKYKMWGVPATDKHPATLDTVDTYQIMSSRRPLIGGWETLTDYFNRVAQGFGARGAKSSTALFEGPYNRQALRRACEHVPVPRNSRQG